jgi:flagellar motor switch/type III secretory pathway protein FliN
MIELDVVVARFTMTLADVQRLKLGDTVPVGQKVGGLVELRANGRRLALAELAQNELGEIHVMISEFVPDAKAAADRAGAGVPAPVTG